MAGDESNQNKDRLKYAYTQYLAANPQFFYELKEEVRNDDSKISQFIADEDLSWPTSEAGLIG